MADELKIDTTVFRDAAAALRTIRDEFMGAENNSAATAAVVEHAKLGEKITDFASNWDSKRVEYAEIGVKEYWIIDRFRRTLTVAVAAGVLITGGLLASQASLPAVFTKDAEVVRQVAMVRGSGVVRVCLQA